jgi:hypothetical protein
MMGFSAQLYDPKNEYIFANLRYKITRYAMDDIRKSIAFGIPRQTTTIVDTCLCKSKINFDIPCHHVLLKYNVIPLDIIPNRWHLQQVKTEGIL